MDDDLVEWIAAGGGTEAGRDVGCAGVPGMHGGNEVHDLFPMRANALEVNARTTDLLDGCRERARTPDDLSQQSVRRQELGEMYSLPATGAPQRFPPSRRSPEAELTSRLQQPEDDRLDIRQFTWLARKRAIGHMVRATRVAGIFCITFACLILAMGTVSEFLRADRWFWFVTALIIVSMGLWLLTEYLKTHPEIESRRSPAANADRDGARK